MKVGLFIPVIGAPERTPSYNRLGRVVAVIEILVAFVLVHIAFRALKQFTYLGKLEGEAHLNFTPGMVMIAFTVCWLIVTHRSFTAYGLTLARWTQNLKVGLLWGVLLVAGVGCLALLGVRHQPGVRPPTMIEGMIYGIASLAAVVLFALVLTRWQEKFLERLPAVICILSFVGLLCVPPLVGLCCGRPFGHTILTVLWLVFGAGCGEEVFFRGYIQSRVNAAFGRPFRFLGVQFGVGLLLSSVLFGFLHALNSVDYFHGQFTFAWGFGIATFCMGLLYGCLRESTGSIVAGVVTHSILDVLVIVPGLITGL
jgi:membrane protease YdiL (CAAX protease family)